jgi:circadian clock protein KaiC
MDRVRTGIEGLDQLLYGGFLRGDAILVAGAPGTGKTSMGMQFLHNGITKFQEPGLFVTFEEFPERIYRDAASFGWDFPALEKQGKLRVFFTSPEVLQQDVVRDKGLMGEMLAEIGARRVVVDSITNLHSVCDTQAQFREAVYGLVNALRREQLTAMLTQELREQEEIGTGPEEFVADAMIRLTRSHVGDHAVRFLEVIKSRGSPHIGSRCLYFFAEGGLTVLPPFQAPFYRFEESASTGIPELDDLMGGGIPYGAFYLMEIESDINQDIFDAGFAIEALRSGDTYVRIGGASDPRGRWRALMRMAGEEERLQRAVDSGQVTFLWSEPGSQGAAVSPEHCRAQIERICGQAGSKAVRLQVDISQLYALLPQGESYRPLSHLAAACRKGRSVVVGTVSPRAVTPDELEKLRTTADGIVRVWSEGSYAFIQVLKTVNSARTPVYAVRQVPQAPFVQIVLP